MRIQSTPPSSPSAPITFHIGTRRLRPVKLYPLSEANKTRTAEAIRKTLLETVSRSQGAKDLNWLAMGIQAVLSHAHDVLKLVALEEDEDILGECSNNQLLELVGIVYRENFQGLEEQVRALLGPGVTGHS